MSAFEFYVSWAVTTVFGLLHQHKFSAAWDAELNRLIDEHWETADCDSYVLQLGDADVWIANEYFSFGTASRGVSGRLRNRRPSVRTMFRVARLLRHIDKREARRHG